MSNDDAAATGRNRRSVLKAGAAASALTLVGPILGVPASEAANAAEQIRFHIFTLKYGGPFVAGLNALFAYDMIYDAKGAVRTDPESGVVRFRTAMGKAAGGYGAKTFGTVARYLMDPKAAADNHWVDASGKPVDPRDFEADAAAIHAAVKSRFTQALVSNFNRKRPYPVFFFVGTSGVQKGDDKIGQDGYRMVEAYATGIAPSRPDARYLVLGMLCPPGAGVPT